MMNAMQATWNAIKQNTFAALSREIAWITAIARIGRNVIVHRKHAN
jgi:hypothetical protein